MKTRSRKQKNTKKGTKNATEGFYVILRQEEEEEVL
jgi:hypothetical protein